VAGAVGGCEPPTVSRNTSSDTVTLERLVLIGEVAGTEEYQFGLISGLAKDKTGRIYVSDRMDSSVRVFSGDGTFLQQIGREGEGPGEFSEPTDLFFDEAGRLWVRDFRRATVFAPGSNGDVADSVVETRPFRGLTNWTSFARSRLIGGIYYYPGQSFRRGEPDRYFYFGYDQEGVTGDTVFVPEYASLQMRREAIYRISSASGRIIRGLNRAPFQPTPRWELTRRGTVLGGSGDPPLIETNRSGDTLRVIPVKARRSVSDRERADSMAALQERIDSLPVPLEDLEGVSELVRSGVLPDSVPSFVAVHTSEEGEIWVQRWPPAGVGGTHFDVYSAEGEFKAHVRIRQELLADPPPFIDRSTLIGVVQDAETDVHQVIVYRIPGAG